MKNNLISPIQPIRIPTSSPFYTRNNNNNLSNENVENVEEVNTEMLVKQVKQYPGNQPLPSSPSPLNFKPKIPKMTLPLHLRGGKTRQRKQAHKKRKHSKRTRKH